MGFIPSLIQRQVSLTLYQDFAYEERRQAILFFEAIAPPRCHILVKILGIHCSKPMLKVAVH